MKVTWDFEDIIPGRRARTPGCNEVWMIGYNPLEDECRYTVISLSDGMAARVGLSLSEVANHLNETKMQPVELVGEKDRP